MSSNTAPQLLEDMHACMWVCIHVPIYLWHLNIAEELDEPGRHHELDHQLKHAHQHLGDCAALVWRAEYLHNR